MFLLGATGGCGTATTPPTGPAGGETIYAVAREQRILIYAVAREQRILIYAVAREQRILITNVTRQPIFTFVVGRNAAELINWAPCVAAPSCPPLAPGKTRHAPYPARYLADGREREREALVYWWHAIRGRDGVVRPDSIRVRIVTL